MDVKTQVLFSEIAELQRNMHGLLGEFHSLRAELDRSLLDREAVLLQNQALLRDMHELIFESTRRNGRT